MHKEPKKINKKKKFDELDGLVWILNGRVFVKNEVKDGMPPIINPCEKIKLFINGMECNHLTTVSEQDEIELKETINEIDAGIEVEISDDGLKAFLYFTPSRTVMNMVVDTYPTNKLDVSANQVTLELKKTSPEYLLNSLRSAGVVYGINTELLELICKNNMPGRFLIAEGVAPENPTHDEIEYMFNVNEVVEFELKENELGNVDFRNISSYESVTAGQVIARLHTGLPGKKGISVTGEDLNPPQAKKINITPSLSVTYDKETGEIRANKPGRPIKQEKGNTIIFHIYDAVVIEEVSIKTGNIWFKGDIEVKRNVCESMEVIARQNVLIKGNVDFASIYAGNNITIKGSAISSKINAAMSDVVAKDPAPLMEKLITGIDSLINNIKHISSQEITTKKLTEFSEIVRYLLNEKNKELPAIIYDVLHSLRKDNYDIDENFILSLMKSTRSLMGNYSEVWDINYLNQIVSDVRKLFSGKNTTAAKGCITLNSVTNCEVSALGNVTVLGKGCVNSIINCNGKATVTGYVRGGQIRAEKGIEVNIAGSERGSKILLAVPEDSYIQIRTAHIDTTIKVGRLSHTFLSVKKMVRARIENGKLIF